MRRDSVVRHWLTLARRCRVAPTVLATAVALLGVAAVASATTGPGYLLKHPGYTVTAKEAKPYLGVFKFKSSGSSSKVVDASMFAEFGEKPQNYLVGQVQVYAYDKTGREGDWDATLYNWRWTGSQMEVQLVGFGGSPLIGYMVLKAGPNHTLSGSLVTTEGNNHYAVAFTRTGLESEPAVGPSPFPKKKK
jgi:hypothetical protein